MKPPLTLFQCDVPSVAIMLGRYLALFSLALGGALGFAAPALSQDVTPPCALCAPASEVAEDKSATPVSLSVETKLDFGQIILASSGEGSAQLGPDGARNVTGSVTAISARAMLGEVVIRGEPGRSVRIDLPNHIELFGMNGGSIRLDSIRSDLPQMPRLDENGRLSFRFGGMVRLTGDVDGQFRGDVPIDVEYF
jgi:hypothetical protein